VAQYVAVAASAGPQYAVKDTSGPQLGVHDRPMTQKKTDIFKDNAFEFEFTFHRRNTNTGEWEPATGILDLFVWIAAVDGGPEVDASLKVQAQERALKPGTYFGIVHGAAITGHVFPVADGTQFYAAGGKTDTDAKVYSPRKAWNVRHV
jgi:hypothetical protein